MAGVGEAKGRGLYKFLKGITIEGHFSNGLPNGTSMKITYPDGSTYEGNVVDGLKDGGGKFTYADQAIYIGDYK